MDKDDDEPEQFLADLPPPAQPTPAASSNPEQERRAQISASPYLAPFTPGASPPRPKTPSTTGRSRQSRPQLVPVKAAAFSAPSSVLPRDDVTSHLPPKLLEALAGIVRTLDQLTDGAEDFRPDQLGLLQDKAARYVELLRQADAAAKDCSADVPVRVLQMLDEEQSNPELFTRQQLQKCQEESESAAGKADALEILKGELLKGLYEMQ